MRIALFPLITASILPAQIPGTFKQIDIDGGGWFTGISQHQSGRLYGRTDVGGVYRSDDRGDSWTYLSGDISSRGGLCVQGIAISKANPDTVYQACGVSYFPKDPNRGIWKSTDAGASWQQVKSGLNFSGNDDARHGGECLAIHPANDFEIWAGSRGDGLWRSTDAGKTWTQIGESTFATIVITGITLHPKFPDQVWVSTEGGLWISRDRGASWKRELTSDVIFRSVRRPDGSGFAIGGKYRPSSPSETKLWHITMTDWTTPGEVTFTDRWANYVTAFQKAKGYPAVDQAAALGLLRDGSLVTAGFFRSPARSTDNGLTFEILPSTITGPLPAWALRDRNNHQGGWNQIKQDVKNDQLWFTTGGYGPSRTDDSGQTWQYITAGIGEVVTWRTQFHPTDGSVILPAADHGLAVVKYDGNQGQAWNTISRDFPYPDDILTFAHSVFARENTIVALGGAPIPEEARVWRSDDAGATWQKLPPKGYPKKRGYMWVEMCTTPDGILGLMGGPIGPDGGGLYRSTDLGASFQQVQLPAETTGRDAGNEFVWNSRLRTDGGDPSCHYLSIKDCGIFRSHDKGRTWKKLRAAGLSGFPGWLGVDHRTKHQVWFAGYNGLHHSDDGGDTWLKIKGFEQTFDVDAVEGRVAVIGKRTGDDFKKIYYSDDNGKLWREITRQNFRFGNMDSVAIDPHRPGQVWISTNGRSTAVFIPSK